MKIAKLKKHVKEMDAPAVEIDTILAFYGGSGEPGKFCLKSRAFL